MLAMRNILHRTSTSNLKYAPRRKVWNFINNFMKDITKLEPDSLVIYSARSSSDTIQWKAVDDKVFGGLSTCKTEIVTTETDKVIRFSGEIKFDHSIASSTGIKSSFCALQGTCKDSIDLRDYEGFEVSLRSSTDLSFIINMECQPLYLQPDLFQLTLEIPAGEWCKFHLPFSMFTLTTNGKERMVQKYNDSLQLTQMGLIVADTADSKFQLEIKDLIAVHKIDQRILHRTSRSGTKLAKTSRPGQSVDLVEIARVAENKERILQRIMAINEETSTSSDYIWKPTPASAADTNVVRLMAKAGCNDINSLRKWSHNNMKAFWDLVVTDLGIPFSHPYTRTYDDSKGIQWTTWFSDGKINITSACIDRWRALPADADSLAIISEGENGKVEKLTYEQLGQRVDELAGALRADGVKPGDAVAVFMPMIPNAVVAAYAIAKIGAIFLPIFSGFAAGAIISRIQDANATTVLTAAGSWRKGKSISLLTELNKALSECPTVKRVVILPREGIADPTLVPNRDILWKDFLSKSSRELGTITENTNAEDTWMVIYTSGTTGKPKGAVHVHGGFTVKIASEAAYALDIRKGDRFQWITDMGWIMGPLTMIGAHSMGATMVMLEGAPDYPNPSRIWKTASDHCVTFLGISPTLIRALKSAGDEWTQGHDLSQLRSFGSTGEPWNPEPYMWLFKELGDERIPIINISGGTEVGACFLTAYPVEPLKVCSLGGPCLGVDIDVFDPEGKSLRGKLGELVCKAPWPGMTRGIFKNNTQRYLDSYWSMYPNIWRHGDWALVDDDGSWFLHGRSDEAVNVAGKRIGPAEVESVLVADSAVAEAAMVGVPDDLKGECIWVFWVPVNHTDTTDITQQLNQRIIDALGRPFAPARIIRVPALPKTRSAKIMRRAVRALCMDADPGDLSSAENPETLSVIKQIIKNSK